MLLCNIGLWRVRNGIKMKTLIIVGSPHKNGDTAYLVNLIKEGISGEVDEIWTYFDKIRPCVDCRYCYKNKGCAIRDDMDKLYKDDYDNVIIASPVHMYNLTPPTFGLVTRLNCIWSNKHFLKIEDKYKEKQGFLVLVGGGSGEPKHALEMAKLTFKFLNAKFDINEDYAYSLNTDEVEAKDDEAVLAQINKIIAKINSTNK